jgi:hypothetical protein
MSDFLSLEDLENKFDINYLKKIRSYPKRLKYVRNSDNLPDDLVYKMQNEVLNFLIDDETMLITGYIGKYRQEGTIFVNLKMEKVGFRDYRTNKFRTALSINSERIKKLSLKGFHSFPNAGNT